MSENVQSSFIQYLQESEYVFFDNNQQVIQNLYDKSVYGAYLYKSCYGEICMRENDMEGMDIIDSPLIEFDKTLIKENEKRIVRGRIWIEDKFYNGSGDIVKKDKKFTDDYRSLVRWIKKNVPFQEIPKGEYLIKEYVNDELKEYLKKGYVFSI